MGDPTVTAMVQTAPRAMELRELPRPTVGADQALIRVEACGICGTDIGMYADDRGYWEYPIVRGHEPVGLVEEIGTSLAARTGLRTGDRVAVDPFLRCGTCRYCLTGRGELCDGGDGAHNSYATIPLRVAPGLWGGFATHLLATEQTVLYPVPPGLDPTTAALFNALGAGIKWTLDVGGVGLGSSVVVLGSGQRGLCCALAALEAGAAFVAVTGLTRDAYKLDLARELGVHLAVDVEREDLAAAVAAHVPRGVDVVVDTTPRAPEAIVDAIRLVRTGGTVVAAGIKREPTPDFPLDELIKREVALRGVLGTGAEHYRQAIALIAGSRRPLHRMVSHVLPLERLEHGIRLLAGEVPDERPLAVVIDTRTEAS
jgi:threonine dehydrogenase-like Zn-dependent dehydrogenase